MAEDDAATQLIAMAAEIVRLRVALTAIRDIEKPESGPTCDPSRDWMDWYVTSGQQTDIARSALTSDNCAPRGDQEN